MIRNMKRTWMPLQTITSKYSHPSGNLNTSTVKCPSSCNEQCQRTTHNIGYPANKCIAQLMHFITLRRTYKNIPTENATNIRARVLYAFSFYFFLFLYCTWKQEYITTNELAILNQRLRVSLPSSRCTNGSVRWEPTHSILPNMWNTIGWPYPCLTDNIWKITAPVLTVLANQTVNKQ